jgi:hypothetical protein
LSGNLDLEAYERSASAAESSAQEYEAAENIIPLGQAPNVIEDGSPAAPKQKTKGSPRGSRNEVPQMTQAVLDRRGDSAEQPEQSADDGRSSPLGDLIFGLVLAPLLCLFAFSLNPDPVMQAQDPNCEPCAQLHRYSPSAELDGDGPIQLSRYSDVEEIV